VTAVLEVESLFAFALVSGKRDQHTFFFFALASSLFAKNAKKPGYNGSTHTAVSGVSSPRTNAVAILKSSN